MNTEANNLPQGSNVSPAQNLVAVMTTAVSTELQLKGKSPLRRNLHLRANPYGDLSVVVVLCGHGKNAHRTQGVAYCNEEMADCYLHVDKHGQFNLWLNHAAFDVSEAEARQIREKCEPLGLRVEAVALAKAGL